jgi:hypothetical protein
MEGQERPARLDCGRCRSSARFDVLAHQLLDLLAQALGGVPHAPDVA